MNALLKLTQLFPGKLTYTAAAILVLTPVFQYAAGQITLAELLAKVPDMAEGLGLFGLRRALGTTVDQLAPPK